MKKIFKNLLSFYVVVFLAISFGVFYSLIKYQSNILFESEKYTQDFLKFILINFCIGFAFYALFREGFNRYFLSKKQDPEEIKEAKNELMNWGIVYCLGVLTVSGIDIESNVNIQTRQFAEKNDLKVEYVGEYQYNVYKLKYYEGQKIKLGTGAEIYKAGKVEYLNLGKMTCQRSMKECVNLIVSQEKEVVSKIKEMN